MELWDFLFLSGKVRLCFTAVWVFVETLCGVRVCVPLPHEERHEESRTRGSPAPSLGVSETRRTDCCVPHARAGNASVISRGFLNGCVIARLAICDCPNHRLITCLTHFLSVDGVPPSRCFG